MTFRVLAAATAVSVIAVAAHAQDRTEIQFWHAMGGQLGERTDAFATDVQRLAGQCTVTSVYQGNYTETMTAAIAAFRAGEQPHIVQVFEVGTATMMAAEGAIYPVHQLMEDQGIAFDEADYLPGRDLLLLRHRRQYAVAALQLLDPGDVGEPRPFAENDLEIPTTWDEVVGGRRAS
jgi:sn-glycerol 3-phosphate transport system substrate-binding protein